MLYHLASHDPDDYGTIRFSSNIHKSLKNVRYRINNLGFNADILMTTEKDFLLVVFEGESVPTKLYFKNHGAYNPFSFLYELSSVIHEEVSGTTPVVSSLKFSFNNVGLLTLEADRDFSILDASHNVQLLLGIYNAKFPLNSKNNILTCPSVPMYCYGNTLYLTSRTGQVCGFNNENDKEETRSIAYKVNDIIYPGFPVICKIPGSWSSIHSSQLSDLTFQLVDFQLQPIKLMSPLFVTLEVSDMYELKTDFVSIEKE